MLAEFDTLLQPRSAETLAEIAEAHVAGLSERRIATLYPLSLADYARGVNRLLLIPGMSFHVQSLPSVGAYNLDMRLRPEVWQALEAEVKAVRTADWYQHGLLLTVAVLRLLSEQPVSELFWQAFPGSPQWPGYAEEGQAQLAKDCQHTARMLTDLQDTAVNLRRRQELGEEGDPLARAKLRLRQLVALLGLHGARH